VPHFRAKQSVGDATALSENHPTMGGSDHFYVAHVTAFLLVQFSRFFLLCRILSNFCFEDRSRRIVFAREYFTCLVGSWEAPINPAPPALTPPVSPASDLLELPPSPAN